MATVAEALNELKITEWVLRGEPKTEDEFKSMFRKVTGADVNGTAIESDDPSKWGVTWKQVSDKMTAIDAAAPMKELRRQRDAKLAETDWTALADVTMADNMKTYRQALRDLPAYTDGKERNTEGWGFGKCQMASETSVNVLDNVLGITDVVETSTSTVTLPEVKVPEEVDNDYEYQRRNFYQLIERGQDAIDGILELAKESETPRSYEVAGNMIKQVADVTEKLGELQLKMQKLKEVPSNAPKNVTNALFVGSTSELQKMLKGK